VTGVVAAAVRRTNRALTPDCPRLDDLVQIASELVACGILFPEPDDHTVERSVRIVEGAAEITVTQDVSAARNSATGKNAFGRAMCIVMEIAETCHHHTLGG
jgi:hypothetical protein